MKKLALTCALFCASTVSHAVPVRISFEGLVSSYQNLATSAYDSSKIGTAFSGQFTFDVANVETVTSSPVSYQGASLSGCRTIVAGGCTQDFGNNTPLVTSYSFTFDGTTYFGLPQSQVWKNTLVQNRVNATGDATQILAQDGQIRPDGTVHRVLVVGFQSIGNQFSDITDLDEIRDFSSLTEGNVQFLDQFDDGFNNLPGSFNLRGILTSAEMVVLDVPEPGSLALLGLGLASLAWTRRRRIQ